MKFQLLSVFLIAVFSFVAAPSVYAEEEQTSSDAPMIMMTQEKPTGVKGFFKKVANNLKTSDEAQSADHGWTHPALPDRINSDSQY